MSDFFDNWTVQVRKGLLELCILNALAEKDYAGVPGVATDCGGSQPTYMFASMPGLGTTATAADGTPMRNWWVYLFY